ncbi:uncharacterized mitochondrial protein AtMg00820-like [Hevea brasiliensis]|uniref:uncharacterized mitochondrial protein AtMg00820-like n=1 Tax=Hevea brasiliensis TaxID=3981 RepID=UPI0025F04EAC|nr:uncharacterized mitochondrial protein AtMg00820-like [Hevea brasiliensis]
MITRSQTGSLKPKTFSAVSTIPHIPSSYNKVVQDKNWRVAMNQEVNALIQTDTWELVPRSSADNIIAFKWIFRIKQKQDGSIDCYKARLVAKGFHQRPGLDFFETFSPRVKPMTIRIILSIAVFHGWELHQLDVSNAFLHGDLDENVFME